MLQEIIIVCRLMNHQIDDLFFFGKIGRQIVDDGLPTHIVHNLTGCVESPLAFTVILFEQVFKDPPHHFRVDSDLFVVRAVFDDGKVVLIESSKYFLEKSIFQIEPFYLIIWVFFKQTTI